MHSEIAGLQKENKKTMDELITTKRALEEAKKEIISLHPSTTMLDNVLAFGRRAKDNRGLGYVRSSNASAVQPKTIFVKPSRSTPEVRQAEKEKVSTIEVSKKGKKRIPTCWNCGELGHTYHKCWNVYYYPYSHNYYSNGNRFQN